MFTEGWVKKFNAERGFGFIELQESGQELFFHISDIVNPQQAIKIGERLRFVVVEAEGAFKAIQIERLDIVAKKPRVIAAKPVKKPRNLKAIFLILCIVGVAAAVWGYFKYQDYQQQQQEKLQQLMQLHTEEVLKQRAALGHVPEQVLSTQALTALNVTPRESYQSVTVTQSQSSQYQCDGRVHCSQMRSYEEALFFLRNCPGTRMDGDNDGIPCESQYKR